MSNHPATSSAAAYEVDPSVWRAVVGSSVHIPSPNSYVYYFPEGHVEHISSSPSAISLHNYGFTLKGSMVPCHILSVRFLSDPSSDRAFVKFLLQPLQPFGPRPKGDGNDDDDGIQNDVVSFAKILTPSDANNGGGFSVPRFCADVIFPPLDLEAEPPVQYLTLKDTNNHTWEFRHVYRGTPRRHLLTTGWSRFVNAKRLVAGDSVVFMRKNSTNELFVGIRRAVKFGSNDGRNGGEALESIDKAARGMAFEVAYCPKVGFPDFVVKAGKVKDALRKCWRPGMRVRKAVDTEDASRLTWFQGTIESATCPNRGPWFGSPWLMLQVTWDEPDSPQNMNRVNPWQVEHIRSSQVHDSEVPPKKLKVVQNPGMLRPDGDGEHRLPVTKLAAVGHLNSAGFSCSHFPSGMQVAKLDRACGLSSNPSSRKSYQAMEQLPENDDKEPEVKTVSTILSIGSSYPDSLSPGSQSSVHNCGTDLHAQPGHGPLSTIGSKSLQLFGKIIQLPEPVSGGSKHNAS